jgi:protein TonB
MGEHFDAVVVDCDNEQNATLLLKSARNAPNNQSALAVAVVEGQAGVAKAFRIGANLVLTKPINVEQAKGTLRVARGLLRKNESAKPATAPTVATAKPAVPAPAPGKPALVPSVAPARPASAVSPVAAPGLPPRKPAPEPSFAASASSAEIESGEADDDVLMEVDSPEMVAAIHEPKPEIEITSGRTEAVPAKAGLAVVSSAGAAAAAAPAREAVTAQEKPSTVIAEAEAPIEKNSAEAVAASSAVEASAMPAPTFTFGGAVEAGNKSASGGGSKKTLLAVAAVVVIAAAGYGAWTQFGHSSGTVTAPAPVVARPVTSAPAPQAAPSAAVTTPATVTPSAAPASTVPAPTESETPASTVAEQPSESAKASAPTASGAGKAQPHPGKTNPPAKAAAEDVEENDVPATKPVAQPLVIKNGSSQAGLGKVSPATDAPAPSIAGIAAAGNGGTLPNLMGNQSSAPAPVLQAMNISQGVSQGLILKKTPPVYPPNALRMRIEGTVELQATISKKGDISAVKILSGDASLARAAAEAVKQWKYKPYLLDGSPVEIQTQVTVNFKLPR